MSEREPVRFVRGDEAEELERAWEAFDALYELAKQLAGYLDPDHMNGVEYEWLNRRLHEIRGWANGARGVPLGEEREEGEP